MKHVRVTAIQSSGSPVRPFCSHQFHPAHVNGRRIPGLMVCESCRQQLVHKKKAIII